MTGMISRTIIITILILGCANNSGDHDVELAAIYNHEGDYSKAMEKLKEANGKNLIDHSKQEVYTMIGNLYNELEQYDSSIFYHKKALQIDSNYVDALVNLGVVYRLTSEFGLAEECYTKAKRINPRYPELYISLGALYISRGETGLAIENLERAIQLDPQLALAHSNYSLALAMIGNYDKAGLELKRAVSLGYKNGELIKARIDELKKNHN